MSSDRIAVIGFQIADPVIPWPKRGSAETMLVRDRPGWEHQIIPTLIDGRPGVLEAMCRADLAVHHMVRSEGFAISLADNGFRLSYGGRVFARSADAMAAAEAMTAACADWSTVWTTQSFSAGQGEALRRIIEAAERRGEIMLDRVYPT